MTATVVLAAGGTAGHIVPALALTEELIDGGVDVRPLFVGVEGRLEDRLVPAAGFELAHIPAVSLPRRPHPRLLRLPVDLNRSIDRATQLLVEREAAVVVAFGGYVSYPIARAARRLGIPLIIHEQNSVPGVSNRVAARWAQRVAVTFPSSVDRFARPERCTVTGNPVGANLRYLDVAARRADSRRLLELDPARRTVLVFGGSLGSRSINEAVVSAFGTWRRLDVQILHVTGEQGFEATLAAWRSATDSAPMGSVVEYLDDMADAYAAADLVVCRAGATSIAELSAIGLPSILVPYPYASGDHQMENARALERVGASVLVRDADLARGRLEAVAQELLEDPARLVRMGEAARAWGRPDAARALARVVVDLLEKDDRP